MINITQQLKKRKLVASSSLLIQSHTKAKVISSCTTNNKQISSSNYSQDLTSIQFILYSTGAIDLGPRHVSLCIGAVHNSGVSFKRSYTVTIFERQIIEVTCV